MLEQFLKENFDINSTDIIKHHCSTEEPGTVQDLLNVIKPTTEEIIIGKLEQLDKASKQRVLSYLGGLLAGYKKHGRA